MGGHISREFVGDSVSSTTVWGDDPTRVFVRVPSYFCAVLSFLLVSGFFARVYFVQRAEEVRGVFVPPDGISTQWCGRLFCQQRLRGAAVAVVFG